LVQEFYTLPRENVSMLRVESMLEKMGSKGGARERETNKEGTEGAEVGAGS
jgi:hypothetical protein